VSFQDVASLVELEAAAIKQKFFQLITRTLNAGLCARGGQAKALAHLLLS